MTWSMRGHIYAYPLNDRARGGWEIYSLSLKISKCIPYFRWREIKTKIKTRKKVIDIINDMKKRDIFLKKYGENEMKDKIGLYL